MKRFAVISTSLLFTLLILVIGGVLIAPSFIDFNNYKEQAREQIKKATGHDVAFNGDVSIGIFPAPHVSLEDVVVAAPEGFSGQLASFEALDVNVKMAPLFSGNVEVASVSLVKPVIALEAMKDGRQNWMTPELEGMSKGKEEHSSEAGASGSEKAGFKPEVTLEAVQIEEGALTYKAAGAEPVVVRDINLGVQAKSLQGPFEVEGSLYAFDQDLEIKSKIDAFESMDDPLSVVLSGSASPMGVELQYSGVLEPSTQAAQGEAKVAFKDGDLKAFVTASKDKISLKDMVLNAAGHKVTGAVSSTLSPIKFSGKVNIDGTNAAVSGFYDQILSVAVNADQVNFDEIMKSLPKGSGKVVSSTSEDGGGDTPAAVASSQGGIPVDVAFDVNIGNAVYKTEPIKGLKVVGSLRKNTLILQNLLIDHVASASVQAKGKVGNVQSLSGLDLSGSANIKDVKKFASFAQIDPSGLPQQISSLQADVALKGDMKLLDMTATIKALGGSVTAQGAVKNPQKNPSIDGLAVRIRHPNFNKAMQIVAPAAPQYASWSKPLDFKANIAMNDKVVSIGGIQSSVAGTTMSGSLTVDTGAAKPSIKGALSFGDLVMKSSASTAPAGGAAKSSSGGSSRKGERWSSAAMDSSWLSAMDANLDIKASSLVYETWDLRSPAIKFVMKDGALNIQNLKAGLYGGTLAMASVIKAANADGKGMNITADTRFSDVDLEKLAGSFIGTKVIQATGKASLVAKVSGSGVSQKALISSLAGDGTLTGQNIVMEGFDLARFARAMSIDNKPGDTAMGLWKTSQKGGQTAFDTMDGAFSMSQGIIDISKLDMDGPKAVLSTVGNVNLPQWTVATTHKISLKGEDVPPFEVKVSGSLDNPADTFGKGAAENYLRQKLNRKLDKLIGDKLGGEEGESIEQKLIGKFLGGGKKKKSAPEQPQQQEIAPASGEGQDWNAPAQQNEQPQQEPVQQKKEEITPEDAVKGLLKGILQ